MRGMPIKLTADQLDNAIANLKRAKALVDEVDALLSASHVLGETWDSNVHDKSMDVLINQRIRRLERRMRDI